MTSPHEGKGSPPAHPPSDGGLALVQERARRRVQLSLAVALLVVGAVALLGLVGAGRRAEGAVELLVPPRLQALRSRLQLVENSLMGKSGGAAMRLAEQAQSLQTALRNAQAVELRAGAQASGPATLQTLTALTPTAARVRAPATARRGPEVRYASAVSAGAARGPYPLDMSPTLARRGLSAAQKLAANLARYRSSARRLHEPRTPTVQGTKPAEHIEAAAPAKMNPWLMMPKNPIVSRPGASKAGAGPEVRQAVGGGRGMGVAARRVTVKQGRRVLREGEQILARRAKAARQVSQPRQRMVQIRPLLPGQKLPKGAKLLPRAEAAKLARLPGAIRTQGLRVQTMPEEEVEAPPEETIGDTGMTGSELRAFAESEKAKAKFLLGQAQGERAAASAELAASRQTIARGWGKHNKADALWEDAEKHMENSTALFRTYQMELAAGKAERDGGLAQKLDDIAARFARDAAAKHSAYEEALGGAGELKLVPYGIDAAAANSTEATTEAAGDAGSDGGSDGDTAESDEGDESEESEAAV